jgi:hypothetical protein
MLLHTYRLSAMVTQSGKIALLLVPWLVTGSSYLACADAAGNERITCPIGKYWFTADRALVDRGHGADGRRVHVNKDTVEIPGVCEPAPARVTSESGVLNVSVRWARCTGVTGSVSLTGVISGPYCTGIEGNVETVTGGSRFSATLEKCDDAESQKRPMVGAAVANSMHGVGNPWGDEGDFTTVMLRTQAELGCALFEK